MLSKSDLTSISKRVKIVNKVDTKNLKMLQQNVNDKFLTPLTAVLHDVYVGYHHDGGTRGSHGEFYWSSVVADGDKVYVTDSKKLIGEDGIQTGVASGTWLTLDRIPLYTHDSPPSAGAISIGFRLIENDDSDEAKAVFNGLTALGSAIVSAFTTNPAVGTITDGAVQLVHSLLDVDDDDVALSAVKGLHSVNNYNIGRFFSLKDQRYGTSAVFSIIPAKPISGYALYNPVIIMPGQPISFSVDKDSVVSLFIRRTYIPHIPKAYIYIKDDQGITVKSKSFSRWVILTSSLKAGDYHIVTSSALPCNLDVSTSEYGPSLAIDTDL